MPPSSAGLLKQSGPWVERVGFGGTALRRTGTACPARPDAVSCSHASARFLTVCEYSRRPP